MNEDPEENDDELIDEEPLPTHPDGPWGPWGTAVGILASITVVLAVLLLVGATAQLAGWTPEMPAFRFGTLILFELALLVVPFAAAAHYRRTPAVLGFANVSARTIGLGVVGGASIWVAAKVYEVVLRWAWPAAAALMDADEARQLEQLQGPGWLLVLAAVVAAPFAEEVFFRGFVFAGLRRATGFGTASGLAAALFALVHFMSWPTVVPLFVVGLACAVLYERANSIVTPIVAHAVFNGISVGLFLALGRQA